MKATRLLLAAVALAFSAACTSNLTGPSAVDLQPNFSSGATCSDDPNSSLPSCEISQQGQQTSDNRGQHGSGS